MFTLLCQRKQNKTKKTIKTFKLHECVPAPGAAPARHCRRGYAKLLACEERGVLGCAGAELFPVLLEQQVIPVQLKHCLEESGTPLQPQHSVWGRG